MDVYVVMHEHDYEGGALVAVFGSRQDAQAYIDGSVVGRWKEGSGLVVYKLPLGSGPDGYDFIKYEPIT